MPWTREELAQRAAHEVVSGTVVNLGIGIPTLVANLLPTDAGVMIHSENGLLGMGPYPLESEIDPQLINAGKQLVTAVPGGSCFDSATSFAMIRGGHVDLAILGGMQVGADGSLANWQVPGKKVTGMGGAMDLVSGAKRVVVVMSHRARDGSPKLLPSCTFPITGAHCVDRVITDLGVLDPTGQSFRVVERAPGVSEELLQEATGAPLIKD
ncbi:MAG TPA: succinyl-CoA--3-ketoacid-CoA transferase [Myxococcales bacterium]|jgi:3-oxoacid CoA-transferase subunit B|nr:succinyl-CoA--3-ketoacid-CoA transferase [Myxococcales bacterium]|tara:strand:+ start:421 stop:1053 length:633 start_codon:yes stop_codon:yes gene_type:complete